MYTYIILCSKERYMWDYIIKQYIEQTNEITYQTVGKFNEWSVYETLNSLEILEDTSETQILSCNCKYVTTGCGLSISYELLLARSLARSLTKDVTATCIFIYSITLLQGD